MEITGFEHAGIRVVDRDRSVAFYEKLGFGVVYTSTKEPVIVLKNASGVELNLIVNAAADYDGKNVLMDVPVKRPGFTHVALRVPSLEEAVAGLERAGIPLSGGPVRLGPGQSAFVRDPDGNVIEFREPDLEHRAPPP